MALWSVSCLFFGKWGPKPQEPLQEGNIALPFGSELKVKGPETSLLFYVKAVFEQLLQLGNMSSNKGSTIHDFTLKLLVLDS